MKKLLSPVLFLVMPLLLSCSEPARIPGFDSDAWQQDKKGCNGTRTQLVTDFEKIRRELYGKSEDDIKAILGKPDGEQLMSRGQRVFLYYLEPGTQCEQANKLSNANRAEVRFNALNYVSEITYLRPLLAK
jgi:hypothetical protein